MNKSFTLIEILVVIVVIGILSAFILVGMSSITSSANIAKGQAFFNSMDNSLLLARVSQWKLDQVNGSGPYTVSDSWNSNTGTLMDVDNVCSFSGTLKCPQPVTSGCPSGNCLSFDGTNDYVDSGNGLNLNLTEAITIAGWVKYNTRKNFQAVAGKGVSYWIFQRDTVDGFYFRLYDVDSHNNYAYGSGILSAGRWVYLVGTWTMGDYLKIYYNGIQAGISAAVLNKSISTTATNFIIGYNSAGDYFNGSIDNVQIYNQAIPTSQIQQNYFIGLNNLYKNNGIVLNEFNQRIGELKFSMVDN